MASNLLIGRKPVEEALNSGKQIEKILMLKSAEGSAKKIFAIARDRNIPVAMLDKAALDKKAEGKNHQGVIAYTSEFEYAELDDVFELARSKKEPLFVVILDEIEDPHNLGAIMRSAHALGAHGIIIPKRRAAQVNEVVCKTAAGASEYLLCVRVANLSATIDELKAKGVWIYASDMGAKAYYAEDLSGNIAIVVGNEGKGIGRLIKEKCDFVISIPMYGSINSLNASNAAAIIMSEAARQRHSKNVI